MDLMNFFTSALYFSFVSSGTTFTSGASTSGASGTLGTSGASTSGAAGTGVPGETSTAGGAPTDTDKGNMQNEAPPHNVADVAQQQQNVDNAAQQQQNVAEHNVADVAQQQQQNVVNVAEHNVANVAQQRQNVAAHWLGGWKTKSHVVLMIFGVMFFAAARIQFFGSPRTEKSFLVGLLYLILGAFCFLISLIASFIGIVLMLKNWLNQVPA